MEREPEDPSSLRQVLRVLSSPAPAKSVEGSLTTKGLQLIHQRVTVLFPRLAPPDLRHQTTEDDVTQQVCERIRSSRFNARTEGEAVNWLTAVISSVIRDLNRHHDRIRRKPPPQSDLDPNELSAIEGGPLGSVRFAERTRIVTEEVQAFCLESGLSPELFEAVFFRGETILATATAAGMPEANLRRRINQLRIRIARRIEGQA